MLRNIAINTQLFSNNRKHLENTEDYDKNSSQNMREFFFTDMYENYSNDIDEAVNYSLEEMENCYQFRRQF